MAMIKGGGNRAAVTSGLKRDILVPIASALLLALGAAVGCQPGPTSFDGGSGGSGGTYGVGGEDENSSNAGHTGAAGAPALDSGVGIDSHGDAPDDVSGDVQDIHRDAWADVADRGSGCSGPSPFGGCVGEFNGVCTPDPLQYVCADGGGWVCPIGTFPRELCTCPGPPRSFVCPDAGADAMTDGAAGDH